MLDCGSQPRGSHVILAAAMHALEGNSCPGHVKKTSYQVADETNDNKASTNDDNLLRRYNFPALHISRIEVSTGGGSAKGTDNAKPNSCSR